MSDANGLQVAVVGLGPMGRGIARVFAGAGAKVLVVDSTRELTETGLGRIRAEAEADGQDASGILGSELAEAAASADLLIEAIVEDMDAKRTLMAEVARFGSEQLIVASNTSSLSIGEMGRSFGAPERLLGLHFFNPPTKMRLVEVVVGPGTNERSVSRISQLVGDVGKVPVLCRDSPNFIVNRVCRPLYYEAELLVTQGVEPAVVDAVACGALGHPMGPLTLLDFTGLHTHLASSETALREFGDPRYRPIPLVRGLVRAGYTGRAVGRGFYDYASEKPRDALNRVTHHPVGSTAPVQICGPDAGRVPVEPADGGVTIYACHRPPTEADVTAVRTLAADRPVVVDSSDGGWCDVLPTGVGWLRLHRPPAGALFAEVVVDALARIGRTDAVVAVLDSVGAASVPVPALPGLVADRLAFCMANEAMSLVEEGLAEPADIDTALRLGMAHPTGPLENLEAVGAASALRALLSIAECSGDTRYRPTQLLRRRAAGQARKAAPA